MRMKIKWSGVVVFFGVALSIAFSPAISAHAACPADMIAYWKLDEAAGPTYVDLFGENDGVGDPGPEASADGIVGGAQRFRGIVANQGIEVPASRSFSWLGSESFSIELWVKPDGAPGTKNQVLIGRETTGMQWWLGYRGSSVPADTGKAFFRLNDGSGANVALYGPSLDSGLWHHLLAVRDGSTGVTTLWVNGVSYGTQTADFPRGFGSDTPLYLGNLTGDFLFKGWMDEVALYDRALTPAEIQAHYANRQPVADYCQGASPEPKLSPVFAPLPDGTIAYWPLDEAAGPTYVDLFGENDGAGDPGPEASADGIVGGAQRFRGIVANQGIEVPASRSFSWLGSESFSIELWVKPDGAPEDSNQVLIGRETTGMQWWLGYRGISVPADKGKAFFRLNDGSGATVALYGPVLDAGLWHHLVAVRDGSDGSTGVTTLWVDGVSYDTQTADFPRGFGSDTPLYLGNLTGDFLFKGWMDEVALYDRALTEGEIQEHYTAGLAGSGVASLRPAPVAMASFSPDEVIEGDVVTLDGSGSEPGYPEAPIVFYLWEQTAGADVTLTGASTATATFTAPEVGEAGATVSFQLTVTAADGQPDSVIIAVPVSADSTPDPDPDPTPDPDPPPTTSGGGGGGCFINSMF